MEADGLNELQRKYCQNVASGMSSIPAAVAAGYSESFARVAAYRLGQNPAVAALIAAIREKGRERASYNLAAAMQEAKQAAEFAVVHKSPIALVRAIELRAKLSGLLIDRVAVEIVDVAGAMADARSRVARIINPQPSSQLEDSVPSVASSQRTSPSWDPFEN